MQVPQKLCVPWVWDTQVCDFFTRARELVQGMQDRIVPPAEKNWRPSRNGTKYNKKGEILANVKFASFLAALQSSQRKSWWIWEEDE